jgi:hypothetical protein
MSEEEELEINEPKTIEEELSTENVKPTTLNKNGNAKKTTITRTPRKVSQSQREIKPSEKKNGCKKVRRQSRKD